MTKRMDRLEIVLILDGDFNVRSPVHSMEAIGRLRPERPLG